MAIPDAFDDHSERLQADNEEDGEILIYYPYPPGNQNWPYLACILVVHADSELCEWFPTIIPQKAFEISGGCSSLTIRDCTASCFEAAKLAIESTGTSCFQVASACISCSSYPSGSPSPVSVTIAALVTRTSTFVYTPETPETPLRPHLPAVFVASAQKEADSDQHVQVRRQESQECQECRKSKRQRNHRKQSKTRKRTALGEVSGNVRRSQQLLRPARSIYGLKVCDVALCKEGPCFEKYHQNL